MFFKIQETFIKGYQYFINTKAISFIKYEDNKYEIFFKNIRPVKVLSYPLAPLLFEFEKIEFINFLGKKSTYYVNFDNFERLEINKTRDEDAMRFIMKSRTYISIPIKEKEKIEGIIRNKYDIIEIPMLS